LPVLWPADVKSFADPCACPRENTRDTQPEPVQQESDIMLFPLSVCLPRDRRPEFGGALFSLCARRNPSAMQRKRTTRFRHLLLSDNFFQGVREPGQDAAPCSQRAIRHVSRELLPASWRVHAHPGGKSQNYVFELAGICGRMPHGKPLSFCLAEFFVVS
jgi:hypothetical protein